jgi:hypothetical protein
MCGVAVEQWLAPSYCIRWISLVFIAAMFLLQSLPYRTMQESCDEFI